jgi:multidrug efflux pump subunit AcrA (membrane-fusion protein)
MINGRRRIVLGSALAVFVLGAAFIYPRWRGASDVPTMTVHAAAFERRVVAEGNLEAAEATPVTAPIDAQGQLKIAWLVPDGSRVKKGDVVVRFDPTDMQRGLEDGESERDAADSRIAGTKAATTGEIRNLERDGGMAREELAAADRYRVDDPDVFSRQEIIRSQIDRKVANKKIETSDSVRQVRESSAKVDLDLLGIDRRKAGIAIDRAKKGLDALEIEAPHDGLLVYKRDWRGEIKKIGDGVWPGEPVAEVPNLATMQAQVFVLEADAGGLVPGIKAKVTVEAHPETVFEAVIKKVDTLAKRRVGWIPVQYFGTTLVFDKTDPEIMKPGQRVRAILVLDAQKEALSVPRNAVFEKDGKKIVYRRARRGFDPVEIKLGPAAVGRVVVESGIKDGDVIALRDPTALEEEKKEPGSPESPTAVGGRT